MESIKNEILESERKLYEVTLGSYYGDIKFDSWVCQIGQYTDYKTQVGFRSWMMAKGYNY